MHEVKGNEQDRAKDVFAESRWLVRIDRMFLLISPGSRSREPRVVIDADAALAQVMRTN